MTVLLRMVKIYLNDQHLLLSSDEGQPLKSNSRDFASLTREIEESGISKTIYSPDPLKDLEEVKKCYHVVQAGGGLVATPNGHILLIHRKGKWDLPKGKLEEGEDLQTCALREVEEETGLKNISIGDKLGITYHTYNEKGVAILKESHWYFMQVSGRQDLTPQTEEDIEQCLWVPLDEIERYYGGAHASIRDVLQTGIPLIKISPAASGI
ncbi:MAG TPA: NUDIX domain-containing protein [Flavisolibacter sp.]